MSDILRLIFPFFGMLLIGYATGRWHKLAGAALPGLTFFVNNLAMPALFFTVVASAPSGEKAIWPFVLTTTFSTYCVFAIAFSLGAIVNGGQVREATIQGLIGSYSNIALLAPGIALAAFGPGAGLPMALVFCFDNALIFATVPLMMMLGGTGHSEPRVLVEQVARGALLHPLVIATILGLIARGTGAALPEAVDALLAMLAAAGAPAALFTVGIGLAIPTPARVAAETPVLIGIKLIVHPLIVYLLLSWVGDFDPVWVHTAILIAALPPAMGLVSFAREQKAYVEGASLAVVFATVISIATITVVAILLVKDVLPVDPFR